MRSLPLLVPVLALSLCAVACGSADDGTSTGGPGSDNGGSVAGGADGTTTIGADGVPVGADGKPIQPQLDGKYEMSNVFDLTTAGIFPDTESQTLKALSELRDSPTKTMLDLLQAQKVPVASQVLGLIPGVLKDQFDGFLDDAFFASVYQNVPFAKTLSGMIADLAGLATKFELVTTLDLPKGDAIGNSTGSHTITGMAYEWSGNRHVINAPDVVKSLEAQSLQANAVTLEKLNAQLETGRLTLGNHTFTIPVGSFAVLAADQLAQDLFGADLRGALGKVVDCTAIGKAVADRCVGAGPAKVCMGHASDITNLCTAGLDVIVSTVKTEMKLLDIPAVVLDQGEARMWDAPTPGGAMDAKVDRIDSGYWSATIGKGTDGQKLVFATFTGKRIGESDGSAVK